MSDYVPILCEVLNSHHSLLGNVSCGLLGQISSHLHVDALIPSQPKPIAIAAV